MSPWPEGLKELLSKLTEAESDVHAMEHNAAIEAGRGCACAGCSYVRGILQGMPVGERNLILGALEHHTGKTFLLEDPPTN